MNIALSTNVDVGCVLIVSMTTDSQFAKESRLPAENVTSQIAAIKWSGYSYEWGYKKFTVNGIYFHIRVDSM